MRKFLTLLLFVSATFAVDADAQWGRGRGGRGGGRHDRPIRVVTVQGEGPGGSTSGNRDEACRRAYPRAESEAVNQCYRMGGRYLGSYNNDCSCRVQRGDAKCHARVSGNCEVEARRW